MIVAPAPADEAAAGPASATATGSDPVARPAAPASVAARLARVVPVAVTLVVLLVTIATITPCSPTRRRATFAVAFCASGGEAVA